MTVHFSLAKIKTKHDEQPPLHYLSLKCIQLQDLLHFMQQSPGASLGVSVELQLS